MNWAAENPAVVYKVSLYDVKVGVWCSVCAARFIGPVYLVRP